MGHSRLLSKLANLLRKTCIKIGWADMRLAPGDMLDGCHFGSPVSIVAARQSGEGQGGEGQGGERHVAACVTGTGWV